MKLTNNIELLEIQSNQGKSNIVLTWDKDNLVLIDAGFPDQIDGILNAIRNAGFRAEALTHLVITHQDWDHIGCIMELQRIAPKLKVLAHEEEIPYIDGRKTPIKLAARLARQDNLTLKEQERYKKQKVFYDSQRIVVSQGVQDKEIIPICGGIEVVHTPGHTPGHIALYLRQSRIMVCGDAATVKEGQLVDLNPSSHFDPELASLSLDKIKSYEMSGIAAYHGGYLGM